MKVLILPTLFASAGLGWLGLARGADEACADACPPGARLEVACADDGSCAVVCLDADGKPICSRPVDCDAPCAASGLAPRSPTERAARAPCAPACAPAPR
jgi:hypothetical protein